MATIHTTALVHPTAQLGSDVSIGPFCVIEAGVALGDGCRIASRAVIKQNCTLGPENEICEGVVLGGKAQHLKADPKPGKLIIGRGNIIRENSTFHLAMHEQESTVIGDHNLFMVGAHVAHDCKVGSNAIFANNVMLGGHVVVQDRAILSGNVGVHQFCRIGSFAMCGGMARVVQDVPPFVTVDGFGGGIVGLNLVGLKRNGFTGDQISQLKEAYRIIYRSGLKWVEVLETLRRDFTTGPAAEFHAFLSTSKRGFVHERRTPRDATIPIPGIEGRDDSETLPRHMRIAG